jgi:hypothetical protein
MPRRIVDLRGDQKPLLDIASYARRGPDRRMHLSSAEVALIARTVRRTPEVMVKVLTHGAQDLGGVRRHLSYLDRRGALDIETDDGQDLSGKGVERRLVEDWDLDLEEHRRGSDLKARAQQSKPKLVHKVLFSMPPGTPPKKVLEAVKNFAREEFGLKHRYAMVLHTNEPHPHVHMVVKAVSEQGVRLNIRKATLREWRREFARHLRELGVEANATERAVRAEPRSPKLDAIYRADRRGASHHTRRRVEAVASLLLESDRIVGGGKQTLLATRRDVERGWLAAARILAEEGRYDVAAHVRRFVERFDSARTDTEQIAAALLDQSRRYGDMGLLR